jgi:hypothetical protein
MLKKEQRQHEPKRSFPTRNGELHALQRKRPRNQQSFKVERSSEPFARLDLYRSQIMSSSRKCSMGIFSWPQVVGNRKVATMQRNGQSLHEPTLTVLASMGHRCISKISVSVSRANAFRSNAHVGFL